MTYALEVEGLTVSYGRGPVVERMAFALEKGDLVGIIGPNGAGKSSLIKAMVGALSPDTGTIRVWGKSGKKATGRITYVPQRGEVDWDFPVTVEDVVTQGRYGKVGLLGRLGADDRRIIAESIELVGIGELKKRQIGELSGGQQQRVFLARALAQQGDIYLLDEPLVGVDASTETAIVDVLRNLRDGGKAVMVVHHDLSTAREYFDKVLLINRERIAFGPVEEVFTPELLQKTYGGRLTVLGSENVAVMTD